MKTKVNLLYERYVIRLLIWYNPLVVEGPRHISEKEVLRERIINKIEGMLEGVRGRGPNNFRVKPYLLNASILDGWVQDPWSIHSPVPSHFKGARFDPDARLIVFATDPWEDEHYAYEGGQFVQVRLIPKPYENRSCCLYTDFKRRR